jgi:hypothetical protein
MTTKQINFQHKSNKPKSLLQSTLGKAFLILPEYNGFLTGGRG